MAGRVAAAASKAAVSIRPSQFIQGGLIDDADIEIVGAAVELYDYEGKADEPALTVALHLQPLNVDGEPEGDVSIEHLSAGKDFVPNDEGTGFVPTGTATALRKNSNFFMFLQSLINMGFDEEKMDNDVTAIVGVRAHINRVPAPKRAGLTNQREDAKVMIVVGGPGGGPLVVPYEQAKGAKGAKAGGAGAGAGAKVGGAAKAAPAAAAKGRVQPKAAAAPAPAEGDRATEVLLELVGDGSEAIKKASLRGQAFKALAKEPDTRNDVLASFADEEWLTAACEANNIAYDGVTLQLMPE